jgi:hypothetical protein
MPTEELTAIQIRVMDLEKIVGDLGKQLRENPESMKIANELHSAKDEITKLNLRLEHFEKSRPQPRKEGDSNGTDDENDCWPC